MTEDADKAAAPRRRVPPLDTFGEEIDHKLGALGHGYVNDHARAVAALARLRQAYGKPIGADPIILAHTVQGLPESGDEPDAEPTTRERAAHTAMTLYAIHQQSNRTVSVHRRGDGFGYAVSQLVKQGKNTEGVLRRFRALGTAGSWDETLIHARGLIQLFRAAGITLDYAYFAQDLVLLQNEDTSTQVRLRWGRDFHRNAPTLAATTTED